MEKVAAGFGGKREKMRNLLLRIILLGVGFLIITSVVPGIRLTGSYLTAFLAGAIFVLLNLLVSPLVWILKLLALPLTLLTLGIMSLLISFAFNILIFGIMGHYEWGISVETPMALLLGSLLLSVINTVFGALMPRREKS
jgi:putative membrane protein